ncbi:MAG: glycosyltransferase family 2 protein [Paludibacteraceae bacterium]|nr:glycosyltransferase family 2 protein [Paludibacteraceae bacterium]
MLFSILIPTYNNEATIERAVKSALNQDYTEEYEVIVANNASTDRTAKVLESIKDAKLRIVTNSQTVSMYENHNVLLHEAKGDYILFCHSDDQLCRGALSILAEELQRRLYPSKFIIWGHSMIRDFSRYNKDLQINHMFSGEIAKRVFVQGGLTPSGTCFSREAMTQMGGFPIVEGTFDIDWIFEALAAFDGWEFEMIDRLLYRREYASTYTDDLASEIRQKQVQTAANWIYSHLNPKQQYELKCMWWEGIAGNFDHIFATPPPTKQERLDALMQRYKKAPWKIWKLLKWVLIKWDCWK